MAQGSQRNSARNLMTATLLVAVILAAFYACNREQLDIGRRWAVCEPICGTWTRQGDSSSWNGAWQNGAVATLTMSVSGRSVTVQRKDHAGVSRGLEATYTGTLTDAGKVEKGRVEWRWPGVGNSVGTWSATIDRSAK